MSRKGPFIVEGDVRLRRGFLIRDKIALDLLLIPIQVPYVSPEMNKTKRVKAMHADKKDTHVYYSGVLTIEL